MLLKKSIFPFCCVCSLPIYSAKIDMLIRNIFVMTGAIVISILYIQRIHTNNIAIMLIIQVFCFKHCNTICAHFCYLLPCCFYCSYYKNQYLLSILHLYHHLFAELVHLYNLPLYWVCWGHKRFLVFSCGII